MYQQPVYLYGLLVKTNKFSFLKENPTQFIVADGCPGFFSCDDASGGSCGTRPALEFGC